MLAIHQLSVSYDQTPILTNVSLSLAPGTVQAIMGPNGSGKSTLAHTIAGNPIYTITSGSLHFNTEDIRSLAPDARARLGIFLSFQQPPAIPGLSVSTLLKESYCAITGDRVDTAQFQKQLDEYLGIVHLDRSFLDRSCNDGFSGGERKRCELLQLLVLRPTLVILDEIDSGLDVDALALVSRVITILRAQSPALTLLIITHYKRLCDYITPDRVHVLYKGTIVDAGDASLMRLLDQRGYDAYK